MNLAVMKKGGFLKWSYPKNLSQIADSQFEHQWFGGPIFRTSPYLFLLTRCFFLYSFLIMILVNDYKRTSELVFWLVDLEWFWLDSRCLMIFVFSPSLNHQWVEITKQNTIDTSWCVTKEDPAFKKWYRRTNKMRCSFPAKLVHGEIYGRLANDLPVFVPVNGADLSSFDLLIADLQSLSRLIPKDR